MEVQIMGFGVLIDIAGSMIIGGIILIMIGDINTSIAEHNFDRNEDLRSSFNLTHTAGILENELRNIGYSADYLSDPKTTDLILLADTSRIKFLYDYDMNKVLDTIYYYLGPKEELSSTPNPDDCYIYKKINNRTPVRIASGVTKFRFEYFNANGSVLNTPVALKNDIVAFQVSLNIASAEKRQERYTRDPYPQEYWRSTTVTARNLDKR
ncbi:MAG: hypothetical protein R6W90_07180 [Ignavibacteriaceae bacterium]